MFSIYEAADIEVSVQFYLFCKTLCDNNHRSAWWSNTTRFTHDAKLL